MSSHLFIALSTKGFGETILGLNVARTLHQKGESVLFLIHVSSESLLEATGYEYMTINDHVGQMLSLFVSQMIERHKVDTLVLSDLATTDLWLERHGLTPDTLLNFGLPIYAIDTWCVMITGTEIDIYWRRKRRFKNWFDQIELLLQPSPLAPQNAGNPYYAMPDPVPADAGVKERLRKRLSLKDSDRIVLFCTAEWQQTNYRCAEAQRFSETLPHLLAMYLHSLGSDVHLVHIGPKPYALDLQAQYHWISQLSPSAFAEVLGGADLLLTANISSTTIARAMISGVPVLVVINSFELTTASDMETLPFKLDDTVIPWIRDNLPLYRYYMWPVGFYEYLFPILHNEAYLEAIATAELLNRLEVMSSIEELLWSPERRTAVISQQARYAASLERLPNPDELILAHRRTVDAEN